MKVIPSKKEQLVNTETGEIVTSIAIIPEARDRNFVKVFKLMSAKVIEDLKSGIDGAVYTLFWFIDKVQDMEPNQEPTIYAHPETISNDLGISARTARRHLKILMDYEYILQIRKGQYVYELNPQMVFKGILQKYFEHGRQGKKREKQKDDPNEK